MANHVVRKGSILGTGVVFFLTQWWPLRRATFHPTFQHTNMAQGKIFQYCVMKGKILNHMMSWMGTENSVQLIAHTKWEYEYRKQLPNLKHSSVTNYQMYEHSQSLITPWSRVLPGKLTHSLQINPVHASQSHSFKSHFNITFPLWQGLPSGLFPVGLSTKPCMHLSFLPRVPYAQPISIFIRLLEYLMSTDH